MKIVSYNVLAQTKIKRELFPLAGKMALKWSRRRTLFRQFFAGIIPTVNIMCLQEVDFYDSFFKGMLETECGMEGRWASKKPVSVDDGDNILNGGGDGLWMGWKREEFELEEYRVISLEETMRELIKDGAVANIVQIARLKSKKYSDFTLVNTHLYWAAGFDELRARQVDAILDALCDSNLHTLPIIFCGDLNSDPHSLAVKRLESRGFRSVCVGEYPFTVFSPGFMETLDHICVWPSGTPAIAVDLLDINQIVIDKDGGMPSHLHPSDHLPICAHINLSF